MPQLIMNTRVQTPHWQSARTALSANQVANLLRYCLVRRSWPIGESTTNTPWHSRMDSPVSVTAAKLGMEDKEKKKALSTYPLPLPF